MPYITPEDREEVLPAETPAANTVGELNYQITCLVLAFLGTKPHYTDFNGAIGALECAKLELYRRMVVPYEDTKIKENGDVYFDIAVSS